MYVFIHTYEKKLTFGRQTRRLLLAYLFVKFHNPLIQSIHELLVLCGQVTTFRYFHFADKSAVNVWAKIFKRMDNYFRRREDRETCIEIDRP